jgi:hypothetical protein
MVFENTALGRIFGMKGAGVMKGSRKMYSKELQHLNSSSCVLRMIKSGRMEWAWHAACTREKRNAYKLWWQTQKVKDH